MNQTQFLTLALNTAWLAIALIAYFLGRIVGTARGWKAHEKQIDALEKQGMIFFKKTKATKNA